MKKYNFKSKTVRQWLNVIKNMSIDSDVANLKQETIKQLLQENLDEINKFNIEIEYFDKLNANYRFFFKDKEISNFNIENGDFFNQKKLIEWYADSVIYHLAGFDNEE